MTSLEQAQGIAPQVGGNLVGNDNFRETTESSAEAVKLIRHWLNLGWEFRVKKTKNRNMIRNKQAYIDRVEHELDLIVSKGFVDYFLVTSDLVRHAKDRKIPVGPARGSAAASLICYLLRITEVDPMLFPQMLFERFIDPTRMELPDIDLDFSDERRHEVFEYAASKYGHENVGHIANFTRYRGKNSVNDVARVYQIPKWETDIVNGLIIERSGGDSRAGDSLMDTFEMFPKAKEVLERHPELSKAVMLEGNYRGMGVHAAGLVISNRPITDSCAVYSKQSAGRDAEVIAYDKKDAAYLGFLKQDILGLSTMGMIGHALDMIGMDLEELYRIPITDPKTLKAFQQNDVIGIFQFEGRATRLVCRDVVPDNFNHLADINALSRPGPLFSGMAAQYVDIKHGRATPESYHPIVDEHTQNTYGQIIYQEQVLRIIKELGGFPMTKVHAIRQIISQKLGEAQFESMYAEFERNACEAHGCTPEQARRIWRFMATSATYSFNIAHCISYSMLAFWQMWLKVHHTTAFYAAQLRKTPDEFKRTKLLKDAVRHGIKISPPQIQHSGANWSALGERTVCAGFTQIPGIGERTAEVITEYLEERDTPADWPDLINVKGIGPKTIERITAFVDDPDPFGINRVARVLNQLRRMIATAFDSDIPQPTHTSDTLPRDDGVHYDIVWVGIPQFIEYKDLVEDERARSGKDVSEILAEVKDPHLLKSCVVKCIDDGDDEVYVRFSRWKFPEFKERLESLRVGKDALIVKGVKRGGFGVSIQAQAIWAIELE
jgi:DNA polymerase-3 subunit alpha